jgi:hypothetical protein
MENTMETIGSAGPRHIAFELCFDPLRHASRGFAFPCDAEGQVLLNDMSDRLRDNYFYARAVVGNELSWPVVRTLNA